MCEQSFYWFLKIFESVTNVVIEVADSILNKIKLMNVYFSTLENGTFNIYNCFITFAGVHKKFVGIADYMR